MKRKIIAFFLITGIIFSLCGCSFSEKGITTATVEMDDPPKNIDPLLAGTNIERTLVRNVFEPLCRIEQDGKIACAAAESYTVDSAGLVYTFVLPESYKWSDQTPLTAKDFVFQLQRAVSPETKAECANDLLSVKNAGAIVAGKLSADRLGVSASDDRTLVITLERKDDNLLRTLSNEAGMPCNKTFFENCKGKYGLSRVTTLYNGSFYITSWVTDQGGETMSLRKNEAYFGKHASTLQSVEIEFTEHENRIDRLSKEEITIAPINDDEYSSALNAQLNILNYIDSCSIMLFNSAAKENSLMNYADFRRALVLSADWSGASKSVEKVTTVAHGFIPEKYFVGQYVYGDNNPSIPFEPQKAKSLLDGVMTHYKDEELPELTLKYIDNTITKTYLNYIIQSWQKNLGIYVKLTPLDKVYVEQALALSDFDIIITSISSSNQTAKNMFSDFLKGGKLASFADDNLRNTVQKDDIPSLKSAQQMLIDNAVAAPMYFNNGYYAVNKNVTSVSLDTRGNTLDLASVK